MGNSKGRAVYEASLPSDYRRPTSDQAMEAFIRQKYEKKKYIAAEWTNPKPPDFPANWDTAGTAAQEPVKKPEFKKLNIASSKPSVSPQAPAKATAAATASPKPQPQAIKPVAAKPSVGLVKSSSTLDTDLLGLSLGSASSTPSGPSVPSSASSNDLLGELWMIFGFIEWIVIKRSSLRELNGTVLLEEFSLQMISPFIPCHALP